MSITPFFIRHYVLIPDGREVNAYLLQNNTGKRAEILDFGATLRSLEMPIVAAGMVIAPKLLFMTSPVMREY